MEITVKVTKAELEEMGLNRQELKEQIVDDLDACRDYVGFNVDIEVTE